MGGRDSGGTMVVSMLPLVSTLLAAVVIVPVAAAIVVVVAERVLKR